MPMTDEMLKLADKVCSLCKVSKPLSAFGSWKKYGRVVPSPRCFECRRACEKKPEFREKRRSYLSDVRQNETNRARERRHFRKRQEAHPEKLAAKRIVRSAIESGDLIRPDRCETCGIEPTPFRDGRSGIQAHHHDYSKPLDVKWLCRFCHSSEHNGDSNGHERSEVADLI